MKKFKLMRNLILIFGVVVIIIGLVLSFKTTGDSENCKECSWYYKIGDSPLDNKGNFQWIKDSAVSWKSFNIPGKPSESNNSNFAWIKVDLTKQRFREPSLLFMTYDQVFEIYLDNKIIYKFGSFDKEKINKTVGSPIHLIDLPEDYQGKTIYIRMHSLRKTNIGLVRRYRIDSKSNEIVQIVKANIMDTIIAFSFIFIGICSLILCCVIKHEKCIFTSLAMTSIITGIWLFSNGDMKEFFSQNYTMWKYVSSITLGLMPALYYNFIKYLLERRFSKIFTIMSISHLLFTAAIIVLDLLNVCSIILTQPAYFTLFGINLTLCFIITIMCYKNWNTETKIFLGGFLIMISFVVFDLVNWNLNVKHSSIYITPWGILIFLISLTEVAIYHLINTEDKVDKYSKQLDEAIINDQLKTEFFANISHELRTPLNIVSSTLQLLNIYVEDGSISSEKRDLKKYLGMMNQNCYRLVRIVNNIIDMTKIDSGYMKSDMTYENIVEIVEDVTQAVADYVKSKGMNITFDTDVEEKIILCDTGKMVRILLNLLSNAIKFTDEGGYIEVDVHDCKEFVEIIIKDTGIGIEEEKLSTIFERFVQVDKSLHRNHEGSGIGLSLTKSLVEMQDGKIRVESQLGIGTIFTVTFPSVEGMALEQYDGIELNHKEQIAIEFSDII